MAWLGGLALRQKPPDWLREGLEQLDRLLELNGNWDSYGAKQIDTRSVQFAKRLLTRLAEVDTIEAPTVTASPNGNAALCWDSGHLSLDLEVLADGSLEYAYLNQQDPSKDEQGTTLDAERLTVLLTEC